MRHPQLIVFERDGRIAWLLKDICAQQRWSLREPRQLEACLRLLHSGRPAVIVVRIMGKRTGEQASEEAEREDKLLERSLTLIDRAHWLRPDAPIIAVSERNEPAVAALAWNLGAAYVLAPPQPLSLLPELLGHMMKSMVRSMSQVVTAEKEER